MGGDSIPGYEVAYLDDAWGELNRTVLIVEDHEIVRNGMRKIVADILPGPWVTILEASTLAAACDMVRERAGELDLLLLDINLPDATGTAGVEALRADWPDLPIVVVSACEDWSLAASFLKAGALGFIPKSSNVSLMVDALRLIFSGGRYFPTEVLDVLADPAGGTVTKPLASTREPEPAREGVGRGSPAVVHEVDLSPRHREVLALMLQGKANKEIARELGVSLGTAKNYVAVVLRAYNANSRSQALLAALGGAPGGDHG